MSHAVNAATGVLSRASGQIVTMVVTIYAARMLAPAMFGVFAISVAWITLVRTVFYSGAYEYLLKATDPKKVSSECLVVNLLVGLTLTLPAFAFAPFAGRVFHTPEVGMLLMVLAPSNLIAAFSGWQESMVLRGGRIKAYYMICTISDVVSGLVAIVLLYNGFGLYALAAQIYVRNLIGLIGFLSLRMTIMSDRFSFAMVWKVLHWSLSLYLSVFLNFGTTYAADITLGVLLSPTAAGLYRASNRIVTSVSDVIAQPARMIAMTAFAARAAGGKGAERQWASITTVAAVVGWSALGGMAVVGPMLVPAILGPSWSKAAALVPVLCAARATVLLDTLSGTMLVIYDRQRHAFYIQVGGAVVMLASLLAFARFGVVAATWGVLLASVISSAMLMIVGWRHFPEAASEFRKQAFFMFVPMAMTVAGAYAATRIFDGRVGPVLVTVLAIVAGGASWAFSLVAMRRGLVRVVSSLRGEAEQEDRTAVPA